MVLLIVGIVGSWLLMLVADRRDWPTIGDLSLWTCLALVAVAVVHAWVVVT